jgi:hypothetical protein
VDSGFSYHICLKKKHFETLEQVEGGVVHLGHGKACMVQFILRCLIIVSSFKMVCCMFLNLGEIYCL